DARVGVEVHRRLTRTGIDGVAAAGADDGQCAFRGCLLVVEDGRPRLMRGIGRAPDASARTGGVDVPVRGDSDRGDAARVEAGAAAAVAVLTQVVAVVREVAVRPELLP